MCTALLQVGRFSIAKKGQSSLLVFSGELVSGTYSTQPCVGERSRSPCGRLPEPPLPVHSSLGMLRDSTLRQYIGTPQGPWWSVH
jgi:hypothetical protein